MAQGFKSISVSDEVYEDIEAIRLQLKKEYTDGGQGELARKLSLADVVGIMKQFYKQRRKLESNGTN